MANISFGYSDGNVDVNDSANPTLNSMIEQRYSRRQTVFGGLRASAAAVFGTTMLAACDWDAAFNPDTPDITVSAGDDATTTTGNFVTLAGTVTGGSAAAGTWIQQSGAQITLVPLAANSVGFMAPAVASSTQFAFTFTSEGVADETRITVNPAQLSFGSVAKSLADVVAVPAGYTVTVINRLGDPIAAGVPAYANDGTDSNFAQRVGDHGDALYYYGLNGSGSRDDDSSTRGLLVQNHENLSVQYLHPNGPTNVSSGPRPAAEAIKEIEAHGVSITEVRDAGNRAWSTVQASTFNRRITPNTPVVFNGPVRGSAWLRTKYSADGTRGRGTINNCANGHTLWGTNITCEENWAFYFRRDGSGAGSDNALRSARELTALARYGVTSNVGNYAWSSAGTDEMFTRWDSRVKGASAADDFRNEHNQFGWCVELDPYDPAAAPRKRTALGRFAHEGAWYGRFIAGQKLAVYLGDDSRGEYFYKFVSSAVWDPADAARTDRLAVGDKYLDAGTLYVAKFFADGTAVWLPLVFGAVPNRAAVGTTPEYVFADQADILVNTRLAADAVGATRMDRPEWTATNNETGEVYLTLTNNNATLRPLAGTDGPNPRHYVEPRGTGTTTGNPNGHILRLRENGDRGDATGFRWDIYLFGADSIDAPADVNISGLDASNDFSSPDGLWFARPQNASGQIKPLLWIQTDDGAFVDRTNCMMLAALPGTLGDGGSVTITNKDAAGATRQQTTIAGADATAATLKRFLVGPKDCEITGVDTTPDGRTLFVGIQHPGEDGTTAAPTSNWPQSQGGTAAGRPRSAVAVVTRDNGGIVGL